MYKYLFAIKIRKVVCVGYTESVATKLVDHLHDRGWSLEPATEWHFTRQIDRYGGRIQSYTVDANTKKLEFL